MTHPYVSTGAQVSDMFMKPPCDDLDLLSNKPRLFDKYMPQHERSVMSNIVSVWIRIIIASGVCVLLLFFFPLFSHFSAFRDKFYCSRTVHGTHNHFIQKKYIYILKMRPTALFTYLKIILLQYFQFSVFSFTKNKLYPNGPIV